MRKSTGSMLWMYALASMVLSAIGYRLSAWVLEKGMAIGLWQLYASQQRKAENQTTGQQPLPTAESR